MKDLVEKELALVLFQNEFIKLSFNSDLSLLIVKWRRQIFLEERIAGYQTAFRNIKKFQVRNLLVDNSNLFLFSDEEKQWVAATFNGWVNETNIKRFALVTANEYRNLVDLSDYINASKRNYQFLNKVKHEFFTDYETALLWFNEPG